MASRTDKKPGAFKDKNNFAGQTTFVDFSLVRGTLYKCYEYYNALNHPFSKAAFIMFAISEIHPFLDGNGRISRVMMNAELTSAGQSKIIIPTVYREDYILALRKLSRQKEASVYIRMLSKIHQFSSSIFGDFDLMKNKFMLSNAFLEPSEGKLQIGN
jgi:fido (protein-threonine AMPylation protein)